MKKNQIDMHKANIKALEDKLREVISEKNLMIHAQQYEKAARLRDTERQLLEQLEALQDEIHQVMDVKIISGAQTGADQGGLKAAREIGLKTGGWVPKGCKTETGERPNLKEQYNLTETISDGYVERTKLNVIEGDVTIIFSFSDKERGSTMTKNFCLQENKPFLWIDKILDAQEQVTAFLQEHQPKIINIAGNRESLYPGIGVMVQNVLSKVFKQLYTQL